MDSDSLHAVFNRFAGREIHVVRHEKRIDIAGKKYLLEGLRPAKDDPVVKEMEKAARDHGLSLRLLFPHTLSIFTAGKMSYHGDRVNIDIDKAADGTYRVTRSVMIG